MRQTEINTEIAKFFDKNVSRTSDLVKHILTKLKKRKYIRCRSKRHSGVVALQLFPESRFRSSTYQERFTYRNVVSPKYRDSIDKRRIGTVGRTDTSSRGTDAEELTKRKRERRRCIRKRAGERLTQFSSRECRGNAEIKATKNCGLGELLSRRSRY